MKNPYLLQTINDERQTGEDVRLVFVDGSYGFEQVGLGHSAQVYGVCRRNCKPRVVFEALELQSIGWLYKVI